jgi:autophagy-related protein 2
VLGDIDENAFSGDFKVTREMPQTDEDFVTDDVPFNLAFVESYYGDQSRVKSSPSSSRNEASMAEEAGDELLLEGTPRHCTTLTTENDIGHFAEPLKPASPVEKGTFGEFEEQIRVFGSSAAPSRGSTSSVQFVDEHFPTHSILKENAFLKTDALMKLKLRNTRVVWNLHDGYDWPKTRDVIAAAVAKVEQKAAEAMAAKARRKTPQPTRTVTLPEVLYGEDPYGFDEDEDDDFDDDSEIGDVLFNSIYVGVRRGQDPRSLARNINRDLDAQSETTSQVSTTPSSPLRSSRGASPNRTTGSPLDRTRRKALRLKRSRAQKVQINLRNLGVDFDLLRDPAEPGETVLSTIRLRIGDLEILDNVPTSSWNKFVTYWRNGDKRRRETASAMVDLEVVNVKPVHTLSASELVVKVHPAVCPGFNIRLECCR